MLSTAKEDNYGLTSLIAHFKTCSGTDYEFSKHEKGYMFEVIHQLP